MVVGRHICQGNGVNFQVLSNQIRDKERNTLNLDTVELSITKYMGCSGGEKKLMVGVG